MHLRIRQYGEPILRQKGALVVNFDDQLQKLTGDMIETMLIEDASGLAAQQVGYALQMCVIDVLDSAKRLGEGLTIVLDGKEMPLNLVTPLTIVNPELISTSSQEVIYEEGCMSFPGGIYLPISRPELVHLKFQDVQGVWHELKCGGILARCILHEYDHLHGILFIDRAQRRDLMRFEAKFKKLKRESRDLLKKEKKSHA